MEIMIESMMVAERREYLREDGLPGDKGNGFRMGHTYGQGRTLTFRIPRDRYGNFHPRILAVLRSQEEQCERLAGTLYSKASISRFTASAAALLFFLLVIYPVFDVSIDRDALSNIVSIDIIDDIASQGNTFPYIIAIDIINDVTVRRLPFSDKITVNSVDNVAPRHLSLMDVVTDDIIENVTVRCYSFSD